MVGSFLKCGESPIAGWFIIEDPIFVWMIFWVPQVSETCMLIYRGSRTTSSLLLWISPHFEGPIGIEWYGSIHKSRVLLWIPVFDAQIIIFIQFVWPFNPKKASCSLKMFKMSFIIQKKNTYPYDLDGWLTCPVQMLLDLLPCSIWPSRPLMAALASWKVGGRG